MKIKYQIRYRDAMSDKPMTTLFDTVEEANAERERIAEEIRTTWATPDVNGLYLQRYQIVNDKRYSI